jgi:hypothetical protein
MARDLLAEMALYRRQAVAVLLLGFGIGGGTVIGGRCVSGIFLGGGTVSFAPCRVR